MKLDQEQIKKIVASGAVLALLLYSYFSFLLGPLQKSQLNAINGAAALGPQIDGAKKEISKTALLEKQAPDATAFLENMRSSIPDGAPIAWFPPKMANFFRVHGIEKISTHLVSEGPASQPGFRKLVWNIDVPKAEFASLGSAIASLENEEPLLNVLNVSMDAGREEPQYQHATLVVATLVKS